jgi:subtilisin family serine protease
MTLLAPGVFISTTDIAGPAGYEDGDFTETFNGTSSATPAVAAAAALMISANPALSGAAVREILGKTATKIEGQTGWTPELGWGRLNLADAVAHAQAAGTGEPPVGPVKKGPGKKAPGKNATAKKVAGKKAAAKKVAVKKTAAKKTAAKKAAAK